MKDELSLLQAQMTYKKRLEAVLAELQSQRIPLEKKAAQLEQIMLRERKDVDRLEGRSLAAFFYQMAGKKEAKLDLERREYYAARIKYNACIRELDAVCQDILSTEEDLADLADCEARYARATDDKRRAMEAAGTPEGQTLLQLESRLAYLSGQERELEEAITAGTDALQITADILQSIESAKDWATLDILGGGLLTDYAKHDKLDHAQHAAQELQVLLQRFNKELSDVTIRENLQVNIDGMLRFADFFFDGLLVDAAVLQKIKQALAQVEDTREQILIILRQLQDELEQVHHSSADLRKEMSRLIISTEL